jgi:hypothetical protein
MFDIVAIEDEKDLRVEEANAPKAGNVLMIQLGDLEYAPTFGVDMKFFLESEFQFQNESFMAYLLQRLTEHQVNVAGVAATVESLFNKNIFTVGNLGTKAKGLFS